MRNHLKDNMSTDSADYSVLFREMFCVAIAARILADFMCLPFENMGILYDRILVMPLRIVLARKRAIHVPGETCLEIRDGTFARFRIPVWRAFRCP